VSLNSDFQLVAMVKTRNESIWRRSLRPVDVAVILRIVVEIIYLGLFTLLIVQGFLMSTRCRGLGSIASFRFRFLLLYNVYN
jgi:hypothetical protein